MTTASSTNAVDFACEIVATALDALDHALEQRATDPEQLQQSYATVRALERRMHGLTDKIGRDVELLFFGPR